MPNLDLSVMFEIVQQLYFHMVREQHGPVGEVILKDILKAINTLYKYVEPDSCQGPIIVFKTINEAERPIEVEGAIEVQEICAACRDLGGVFTIQLLESGRVYIWKNISPSIPDLAACAVVYKYANRAEYFYAKEEKRCVPKLSPIFASAFAAPSFSNLESSLNYYRVSFVRYSSCPILSEIWYDPKRIFLKPHQESKMRKSLTHFLRVVLRDAAEVRPEQNVDETHPVDIKVTWGFSNRIALIEIKWLGTPKYEDGHLGETYTDYRAREGAQQLTDYLDANRPSVPTHISKGYLVVLDARRANLRPETTSLSQNQGFHYRDREIQYDPAFHLLREDFAPPIRMFVEPKCDITREMPC
jgi:hypothetical protein